MRLVPADYRSELFYLIVIFIVSLVSARVFFEPVFFPTHDLEYHIIRLWQFDQNIQTGVLIPRWAPDLNHGYGVPLFSYMYPLPNYIGETLYKVGFSYIESVYKTVALGFIISAFTFYWFSRSLFSARSSLVASIFYLLAPYHLLDVYIRGSTGEVWVLVFAPLVFGSLTRIIHGVKSAYLLINLSLSSVFLLLSHTILGAAFFIAATTYSIFAMAIYRVKSKSIWCEVLAGFFVAIVMSSYYFVPIIYESSFVQGLTIMDAQDHFPALFQLVIPSWDTGFSVPGTDDSISFQIGIPHTIVLVVAFILSFRKRNLHMLAWVGFVVLTIFLMLEWSKVLWNWFPFMNYFQFPWRLLSLVIFSTSLLAAYVSSNLKRHYSIIPIIVAIVFYFRYSYPVIYEKRDDAFYLSNSDWTQGTATVGNSFNTIWFSSPIDLQKKQEKTFDDQYARLEYQSAVKQRYTISSKGAFLFTPHIAYFPGWVARIDQHYVEIVNNGGIISLSVPAGIHSVVLELKRTSAQKWGELLSLSGIIVLASVFTIYARRY